MYYFETLDTSLGNIVLVTNEAGALTHLYTGQSSQALPGKLGAVRSSKIVEPWLRQIREYFGEGRRVFDLPLEPTGSDFQHQVWSELRQIPYGETRTYGQLAAKLGVPNASRAVGRANATNPISIVVPCHRVIGASGALTGYAGGLDNKRWLLEFEAEDRQRSFRL